MSESIRRGRQKVGKTGREREEGFALQLLVLRAWVQMTYIQQLAVTDKILDELLTVGCSARAFFQYVIYHYYHVLFYVPR